MYIKDSNILLQSDSKPFSQINNGDNGQYYHRYKEGEFYLSSKYLKDAVIDGATNEITSINNYLESEYLGAPITPYFIGRNAPELTKYGFKFSRSKTNYLESNSGVGNRIFFRKDTPITEYYFGCWFCPLSDETNQGAFKIDGYGNGKYLTILYNWTGASANDFALAMGTGTNSPTGKSYPANSFYHIAVILKGGSHYVLIDGVLRVINATMDAIPYFKAIAEIGKYNTLYSDSYIDDFFTTVQRTPIDPTGFTVGQKVFEPPRRGGFNSDIKQY